MNDLGVWAREIADDVLRTLAERRRRPDATYRLQLRRDGMTFRDAAELTPYLDELGVSHVYASPCFKASSGSPHGYDVVDYGQLNPELGAADDYAALIATLRARGMGVLQDIVPNHMGIVAAENAWWNDVLENGPHSPCAAFFDIDWQPVKAELKDKVLLPLLGGQYGEVLESGQLQLAYQDGAFFVRYGLRRLPLEPRTYTVILRHRLEELQKSLPPDSEHLRELESILTALDYLPATTDAAPERVAERQREKEVVKGRLRRLVVDGPEIAEFIERNLQEFNGVAGDAHSFDRFDALLNAQVYRLAHWKSAADEVNYRRFFDINELAAVCTEDPRVFDLIHKLVLDLLARGDIDGLRVDHIDGLYDPLAYLQRLQWGYVKALGRATSESRRALRPSPEELPAWDDVEPLYLEIMRGALGDPPPTASLPIYVVVEKILGPNEPLPADWPVAGTTGYDFLNSVNRLMVDRAGLGSLTKIYQRFIGQRTNFCETAHQARRLLLRVAMSSDLQLLAHRINRISERHRRTRDYTLNSLRLALREILTCFSVYRTYIRNGVVSDRDRLVIQRAVALAKRRNPAREGAVFDFVRDVLLQEQPPDLDEAGRRDRELFAGRFQQVTSPLVAKGTEDTAFYLHFPLASLNEVGGDPERGAGAVGEFHHENLVRAAELPGTLITTMTHDAKRSEDVRARINVLSQVPQWWRPAVNRWARLNRRHRREIDGLPAPSRNDEYLYYQTLVGVWPLEAIDGPLAPTFVDRIQGYMTKAIHEAKERTSWINPNAGYDTAVRDFVASTLDERSKNRFLAEFRAFVRRIVDWGLYASLGQTVLKFMSPGVPDIYQGQELWEFWLVDPDNRQPVDFGRRRGLLAELKAIWSAGGEQPLALARDLALHPRDGRLKLLVTWRSLQFRRQHAELFRQGRYEAISVEGAAAEYVCAFGWRWSPSPDAPERTAMVVVPHLAARLMSPSIAADASRAPLGETVWTDTRLNLASWPPRPMKNLFTGEVCPFDGEGMKLADVFADFPVAVLVDVEAEKAGNGHAAIA